MKRQIQIRLNGPRNEKYLKRINMYNLAYSIFSSMFWAPREKWSYFRNYVARTKEWVEETALCRAGDMGNVEKENEISSPACSERRRWDGISGVWDADEAVSGDSAARSPFFLRKRDVREEWWGPGMIAINLESCLGLFSVTDFF